MRFKSCYIYIVTLYKFYYYYSTQLIPNNQITCIKYLVIDRAQPPEITSIPLKCISYDLQGNTKELISTDLSFQCMQQNKLKFNEMVATLPNQRLQRKRKKWRTLKLKFKLIKSCIHIEVTSMHESRLYTWNYKHGSCSKQ